MTGRTNWSVAYTYASHRTSLFPPYPAAGRSAVDIVHCGDFRLQGARAHTSGADRTAAAGKSERTETGSSREGRKKFVSAQNVQRWLQTGVHGFRIKVGGLVSGSGFAGGPQYTRPDLFHDNVVFRVLGQI